MAIHQGARRIKLVGKSLMIFGSLALLFLWGAPRSQSLSLTLLPFVVGGVIWVIGWIVDGFSGQPDVGRQTRQP
jgi:hypothetical protein